MKRFLINIGIAFFGVIIIHLLLGCFADGNSDGFYQRLSTPKQSSMILGTSRAAQGIVPSEINKMLNLDPGIFNFSFSLDNSPYGEVYYKAIVSKLKTDSEEGIFLLAVDPWSISIDTEDKEKLDEKSLLFGLKNTSAKPNYEYLYKNYRRGWGNIILKNLETKILNTLQSKNAALKGSRMYLHEDGWLEVFTSMEPEYVKANVQKKTRTYEHAVKTHKFSPYRFDYLQKSIDLLQSRGRVFMVRLPVHRKLVQLEKQLMPDFDQRMQNLSQEMGIEYINLIEKSEQYNYTDGNHLYKSSARKVSQEIAEFIKSKN